MTLRWSLGILVILATQAQAAELKRFDASSHNQLGESELSFDVVEHGKSTLKLIVPQVLVDAQAWREHGHLHLDWRNCKTAEMLAGEGELTQCMRRAFLSLNGEGDMVAPAVLDLQILADGRLQIDYRPEGVAKAKPLHTVVGTAAAGGAWRAVLAGLKPGQVAALAAATGFNAVATEFVFFGDSGTGGAAQYQVAKGIDGYCHQATCAFALLLGDNFYQDGVSGISDEQWETKFEKPYRDLGFDFHPVLGNHDHHENIQAQIDYSSRSDHWRMPGRYYSFEEGDAAFFAIDSDDFDSSQVSWLKKRLAASQRPWKIVYGHHPVYSSGRHGDTDYLQEALLPLLKAYHVDFYLSGHDHDQEVIERDGLSFYIVGSGGAKPRPVSMGEHSLFAAASYGFAHMSIAGDEAHVRILNEAGQVQFERSYHKPRQ